MTRRVKASCQVSLLTKPQIDCPREDHLFARSMISSPRLCATAFVCALALHTLAAAASALTLHVAVDGNDSWSGTQPRPTGERTDGPLASRHGARDAIRRLRQTGPPAGEEIRVLVGDGEYILNQ